MGAEAPLKPGAKPSAKYPNATIFLPYWENNLTSEFLI